ncbi:MAG TPA: cytochrome b/b6 domain-containing protein [Terriglobales bacterium]|nr:cytochrome b/b6 domain-containing protein [Terriglobales bacterium]
MATTGPVQEINSRLASAIKADATVPRHSLLVRITHWVITACFMALLVSGAEIVVSHPRFYWGETGNVNTTPLFQIPIPASRALVPTGYGYVLPDQNGWSRSLHFQTAWGLVIAGLAYVIAGIFSGHLRKDLLPAKAELSWRAMVAVMARHLRMKPAAEEDHHSYNVLQRLTYLLVIFVAFPLIIWTGLAMSPSFTAAFPSTVTVLGGRQTARTIHFLLTAGLLLFLGMHVVMVWLSGFKDRMRAMTTGSAFNSSEDL